jgi:hypothetical protein
MAIFSRRLLQRLINENARFLLPRQTKDHVRRLNNADESSLDAEWEVVLPNAFGKLGRVTHDPDGRGIRRPGLPRDQGARQSGDEVAGRIGRRNRL